MKTNARELWKKRVEQWAESGLSARVFAKRAGINANTLSYWKWRLAKSGPPSSASNANGFAASFVEVTAPIASNRFNSSEAPLEVVLPDDIVVRVRTDFDAVTLRRVIDVLGGRS